MDLSSYIQGWRERAKKEEAELERIRDDAWVAARRTTKLLQKRGATSVWLIGSLPRGTFRSGSDLDFLVDGLDEIAASRAAADAADLTGLHVDVVRSEALDSGWLAYHQRYGKPMNG
jgi:predicted nucleotidyltransferase